jgi:hypothetical protein
MNNANKSVVSNEIEVVTESPNIKRPGLDGFILDFYQIFKGELTSILFKLHCIKKKRKECN